jgi:hypothetical protein
MENFNPQLTTNIAIGITLFAAILWGSWAVLLKYLGDYPVDGFLITQFAFSMLFVWGVGLLADGAHLFWNIRDVYAVSPGRLWVTVACGMLYVIGFRFNFTVYNRIGLSLAQPILLSVSVVFGTLFAALLGGVPQGLSIPRMSIAGGTLVLAIVFSMLAGKLRTDAQLRDGFKSSLRFSMKEMWSALLLLTVGSLFAPTYTIALSYGLRSITQPNGFAVMPFMALLASGAFLGSLLAGGIPLTIGRRWGAFLHAPLYKHFYGITAGLATYGGNIINAFGTASLSSVISWPLGVTYGLWTLLWGLVYGEFRGAGWKSYLLLFTAMALYLVGAYLVALQA